ncbi:hypothetical protein M8J77_025742 [Diaphorina citri]|nr:hypothetical protein M8J77_025742 [Diaphorina citri]
MKSCKVVPVVIGALGAISKALKSDLDSIPGSFNIHEIQTCGIVRLGPAATESFASSVYAANVWRAQSSKLTSLTASLPRRSLVFQSLHKPS